MIRLPETCQRPDAEALVREILALPANSLPVHAATTQGGIVKPGSTTVSVLSFEADPGRVSARVQVFFDEVVGGCNCHDDPIEVHGCCLLQIDINRSTADADIILLDA